MSWLLDGALGSKQLREWEALLNDFPHQRALGCMDKPNPKTTDAFAATSRRYGVANAPSAFQLLGPQRAHPFASCLASPLLACQMPSPECLQDCGGIEGSREEPCRHRFTSQAAGPLSESTNWRA